jgi:predicted  nucleic acid-binding Zn-ribbon protein
MVNYRSVVMILLVSALVMIGAACSGKQSASQSASVKQEKEPAAMEQKGPEQATAQPAAQSSGEAAQSAQQNPGVDMPKAVELTGMVEKSSDGIVIVTNMGKYNVTGQDLSGLVGKTVNVTGAVQETAGQYTINVQSVTEKQ